MREEQITGDREDVAAVRLFCDAELVLFQAADKKQTSALELIRSIMDTDLSSTVCDQDHLIFKVSGRI